ncbi:MAG: hydantoinase/oxoprolinase family protein [Pseudomonadota bacterium]
MSHLRAAVDIGGTFTDVQVLDTGTGAIWDHKVPTTPSDPAIGLIDGLKGAVAKRGLDVGAIGMILHGSTIATNAVLERKLPKGGLITTAGFADVLAIGRHMRRDIYALKAEPRPVLVPSARRIGVAERVRADGSIERPLDREAVRRAGEALSADGVTAVAVAFLHAYQNPVHELEAAEVLATIPGLTVATSHETSPEIREFERASTTVLNALLKPVISDYLGRVEAALSETGIKAPLYLVQSNGGVATPIEAARLPVRLLLSGPSGGAMAVRTIASRHGLENTVGMDMGGTSTDICVLENGRIEETAGGEVAGLPLRLPMIEIHTIGAGGGSVARAASGGLRVGPESAGADPGPACYLRGGEEPTVTDANLHLGLIDPGSFLGGGMQLGKTEAASAVGRVASDLALDPTSLASGIVAVANSAMADAVRLSLFQKGADPSAFTLMAFGGAGGLHACAVAEDLNIARVLFPATASTLSARGILETDIRHDLIEARLMIADDSAGPVLKDIVDRLTRRAEALLDADGINAVQRQIQFSADMRYRGQAWEITTPCPDAARDTLSGLLDRFHALHQRRYAHSSPEEAVEIVAVRATVIGLLDHVETSGGAEPVLRGGSTRRIFCSGAWEDVPTLPRNALGEALMPGPMIIEEAYSSLWIHAGWGAKTAEGGDIIAERSP